jgi:hypothetical protein
MQFLPSAGCLVRWRHTSGGRLGFLLLEKKEKRAAAAAAGSGGASARTQGPLSSKTAVIRADVARPAGAPLVGTHPLLRDCAFVAAVCRTGSEKDYAVVSKPLVRDWRWRHYISDVPRINCCRCCLILTVDCGGPADEGEEGRKSRRVSREGSTVCSTRGEEIGVGTVD